MSQIVTGRFHLGRPTWIDEIGMWRMSTVTDEPPLGPSGNHITIYVTADQQVFGLRTH